MHISVREALIRVLSILLGSQKLCRYFLIKLCTQLELLTQPRILMTLCLQKKKKKKFNRAKEKGKALVLNLSYSQKIFKVIFIFQVPFHTPIKFPFVYTLTVNPSFLTFMDLSIPSR